MGKFSVFSTVGTQLPFDRMTRDCEHVVRHMSDETTCTYQIGLGGYRPKVGDSHETLSRGQFEKAVAESDVIVTHAGIGTIVTCLAAGKPLIVVPRIAKLGEHRNDHQLATAKAVSSVVMIATNADELAAHMNLVRLRGSGPTTGESPFDENFAIQLERFIEK